MSSRKLDRNALFPGKVVKKSQLLMLDKVSLESGPRSGYHVLAPNGGADGIRTRYLLTASQVFSQLNYGPLPLM